MLPPRRHPIDSLQNYGQPPSGFIFGSKVRSGAAGTMDRDEYEDYQGAGAAWAAAVANLMASAPGEVGFDSMVSVSQSVGVTHRNVDPSIPPDPHYHYQPYFAASASSVTYRIGGYSATGYLKLWLRTEVTAETTGSSAEIISVDDDAVEIGFVGHPCVPGNGDEMYPDQPAPYPAIYTFADEVQIDENQPDFVDATDDRAPFYATQKTVVKVYKYSCLAGYTPPDDGSANGFPR